MRLGFMFGLLVLMFLLISIPLGAAAQVGVSPARIVQDNLLPGSELQEIMILSKSSEKSVKIRAEINGEAKDWIQHSEEITIPEGKKNFREPISINVPRSAQLGNYSATINYFVVEESNVQMAFSIPVTLVVTDKEDSNYHIKHVKAQQVNDKTIISFEVYNEGNVPSGPNEAEVEIVNSANLVYKAKETISKTEPFSITEKNATFFTEIRAGNYWIDVKLTGENQEYEEEVFLEIENNMQERMSNNNILSRDNLLLGIILIFIILVIIAIIIKDD